MPATGVGPQGPVYDVLAAGETEGLGTAARETESKASYRGIHILCVCVHICTCSPNGLSP